MSTTPELSEAERIRVEAFGLDKPEGMSKARERLVAAQEGRRQRGLHPKGTDQTYEEQTRVLMTWTKAELVRSLIREESDKLKAIDQLIDARAAQAVSLPDRETLARVAGMIRRNCTPSTEAYQRGGDALIYAVADWVENPPEWVLAAQPTKPAAGVTEDALDDLRESFEQELELGGDASTLVPAVTEWLKRWPLAALSTQPAAGEVTCSVCGVTVTDQTPSAFYLHHDERCSGELSEPETAPESAELFPGTLAALDHLSIRPEVQS